MSSTEWHPYFAMQVTQDRNHIQGPRASAACWGRVRISFDDGIRV